MTNRSEDMFEPTYLIAESLGRGEELSDTEFSLFMMDCQSGITDERWAEIAKVLQSEIWQGEIEEYKKADAYAQSAQFLEDMKELRKETDAKIAEYIRQAKRETMPLAEKARELVRNIRQIVASFQFQPSMAPAALGAPSAVEHSYELDAGYSLSVAILPSHFEYRLICTVLGSPAVPCRIEVSRGRSVIADWRTQTGMQVSSECELDRGDVLEFAVTWL